MKCEMRSKKKKWKRKQERVIWGRGRKRVREKVKIGKKV